MEQIYNDFTTKLLPQIQEGLVITKEYFIDLYGRYIKYLILIDTLSLVFCILFVLGSSYCIYYCFQQYKEKEEDGFFGDFDDGYLMVSIIPLVFFVISILFTFSAMDNLIKDIYIPEVRIMQEINSYRINK